MNTSPVKESLPELPPMALWIAERFEGFKTCSHLDYNGVPLHLSAAAELRRLYALQAIASLPQREGWENCTRSHPHENMSEACTLRTEIARRDHADAIREAAAPLADEPKESKT